MAEKRLQNLLYKELSYQIQGAAIEVRKNFGPGHKESVYQNAFAEELRSRNIIFEKEKSIQIFSPKTGNLIGAYRPDFIVDDKMIIELKALENIPRFSIDQLYDYLRNSKYELGYFINFAAQRLLTKRVIFTNDRKPFLKNLLVTFSLIFVLFGVPPVAQAAQIFFAPSSQSVGVGNTFEVGVYLNTDSKLINSVEGKVVFPVEAFVMRDIRDGDSIVSLWIKRPTVPAAAKSGEISFAGVMPGGYVGSDGFLFSIVFDAKAAGQARLRAGSVRVLLNDGKGTEASVRPGSLTVNVSETSVPENFVAPADAEPPAEFEPYVARDNDLYDGKWFLVWETQDKGSGIDHYEVHESTRKKDITRIDTKEWIVSESPYVLSDQELKSWVFVKAVDKVGNETVSDLGPKAWRFRSVLWIAALAVIFAAAFVLRLFRKRKKSRW